MKIHNVCSLKNLPTSVRQIHFANWGMWGGRESAGQLIHINIIIPGFNQPINQLPSNITHLDFGEYYNREITTLPEALTVLRFGSSSQPQIKTLPPNLIELAAGKAHLPFLPDSLKHLKTHNEIPPLPPNLQTLRTRADEEGGYVINLPEHLPKNLKVLKVTTDGYIPSIKFPPYLTELKLCGAITGPLELPSTLTDLTFGEFELEQRLDLLPSSLTRVCFGAGFNQRIDNLPSSITRIKLRGVFNQPIDHLPSTLTHLLFIGSSRFDQPVDLLPRSPTHFIFYGDCIFNKLVDLLLRSLTHLTFGSNFNQPLNHLPPITHLSFAYGFTFSQSTGGLPTSIVSLRFGSSLRYPRPINLAILSSLIHFEYHSINGLSFNLTT